MSHAVTGFQPNQARTRLATMETMYFRMLTELSINRFKWTGLPSSVDERFIEVGLYQGALMLFYFDDRVGKFLCVKGAGLGQVNHYENPTQFLTSGTGMNKQYGASSVVPIWANAMRIPDHDIVHLFSSRLAQIDRTIEINVQGMRNTTFIFVDEEERQSYMNVMRQVNEGQPTVFGTRQLDLGKIQAFNLGIDKDQVKRLMEVKSAYWNEAMTLLGINNTNQEKKERMVSDEVEGNKDQVTSVRSAALKSRKRAAEDINRKWDLSVSVDWDETANQSAIYMGVPGIEGQE